jgi:hypothetical protein
MGRRIIGVKPSLCWIGEAEKAPALRTVAIARFRHTWDAQRERRSPMRRRSRSARNIAAGPLSRAGSIMLAETAE